MVFLLFWKNMDKPSCALFVCCLLLHIYSQHYNISSCGTAEVWCQETVCVSTPPSSHQWYKDIFGWWFQCHQITKNVPIIGLIIHLPDKYCAKKELSPLLTVSSSKRICCSCRRDQINKLKMFSLASHGRISPFHSFAVSRHFSHGCPAPDCSLKHTFWTRACLFMIFFNTHNDWNKQPPSWLQVSALLCNSTLIVSKKTSSDSLSLACWKPKN